MIGNEMWEVGGEVLNLENSISETTKIYYLDKYVTVYGRMSFNTHY